MKKGFSQIGQDVWVESVTRGFKNKFFVEAGALDGKLTSNTLLLEMNGDWKGVCIEPGPSFESLKVNRRCFVDNACLARESGGSVSFKFVEGDPVMSGIETSLGKKALSQSGIIFPMKTKSLTEVLESHLAPRAISYLSLDTEGSELDILRGIDFAKYSFGVMTIEHNYDEGKREETKNFLKQHGYFRVRKIHWDDWYMSGVHFSTIEITLERVKDVLLWLYTRVRRRMRFECAIDLVDCIFPFRWGRVRIDRVLKRFKPAGIIHIGAHHGQEAEIYERLGVKNVIWIEANPKAFSVLEGRVKNIGHHAVLCFASNNDGGVQLLNISSNNDGVSSSVFQIGPDMKKYFPEIKMIDTVRTESRQVDSVLREIGQERNLYDMVVLDVQGGELAALQGMENTLNSVKVIVAEISREHLYQGAPLLSDIDRFLLERGFRRHFQWIRPAHTDMLYFR